MTDPAIPFEAPLLAMTEGSLVPADPDSRLAEHLRRLSPLFRAVGHDLRGPLHSLALQLELLRQSAEEVEDADLRARQGRYAAAMSKEIARLARMLESLGGSAEDAETSARFDLRETTEEIRAMAEAHFRRQQVGLSIAASEAAVEAEGSRAAVRHAGLDLLLYAAERVPGADLSLSAEKRERAVVLAVTARPKEAGDAPHRQDESTEEAPFAADRIARRMGGVIRAQGPCRWELELPRPRTPEPDKENHAAGTHR